MWFCPAGKQISDYSRGDVLISPLIILYSMVANHKKAKQPDTVPSLTFCTRLRYVFSHSFSMDDHFAMAAIFFTLSALRNAVLIFTTSRAGFAAV